MFRLLRRFPQKLCCCVTGHSDDCAAESRGEDASAEGQVAPQVARDQSALLQHAAALGPARYPLASSSVLAAALTDLDDADRLTDQLFNAGPGRDLASLWQGPELSRDQRIDILMSTGIVGISDNVLEVMGFAERLLDTSRRLAALQYRVAEGLPWQQEEVNIGGEDEWDAALCVVLEIKRKKMLAAEGDVLRGGERGGSERRPPRPGSRPRLEAMLVGQASPEANPDSVSGSTSPVLRPGVCC